MFILVGLSHLSQADAPDAVATAWDITSASRTPADVQWCLRGGVCWPFVFLLLFVVLPWIRCRVLCRVGAVLLYDYDLHELTMDSEWVADGFSGYSE